MHPFLFCSELEKTHMHEPASQAEGIISVSKLDKLNLIHNPHSTVDGNLVRFPI